jgi:hypothetical protein
MIKNWKGQAFNQVPHSANEIHGDALAKAYGFKGGLVPGVTVSAYLLHPAVEAWGLDWLERGSAQVRVVSPLYDEEDFVVIINEQSETHYQAELRRPDGTVSAQASVALPAVAAQPLPRRGDSLAADDYHCPQSGVETWSQLRDSGCKAFRYHWGSPHEMQTYLRDASQMPALLRPGGGEYANMSYILGCSNWVLMSNASMNPWVHLETSSQNYRAIAPDTPIVGEMQVTDFYEKRGHEFIDAQICLFDERDDTALSRIDLRAIYKLRGS